MTLNAKCYVYSYDESTQNLVKDIKNDWNLIKLKPILSNLASVFPAAVPHSKLHHINCHLHSLSSHLSLSTRLTLYMGPAAARTAGVDKFSNRKSDVLLLNSVFDIH